MTESRDEHHGPLHLQRKAHLPIDVDCSSWGELPEGETWTSGPLHLHQTALPPIDVDFSHVALPAAQLHVEFEPIGKPQEIAVAVLQLYQAISDFECGLGGHGLIIESNQAVNGRVQLVLSARDQAGSTERLCLIADALNQAVAITVPKEIVKVRGHAA